MVKCYICGLEDWHSMAHLNKERELLVCKTQDCGNVAYRVDPDAEEKMKNYYRFQYRAAPDHRNIITTSRKLEYIRNFLHDFLEDKKGLVCADIGAATGYVPRYLRSIGHRATGCEYTITFRRFSEHFYGIPLTEELEKKHKYDLITIYHVLEHMTDPDKKLADYAAALSETGRIMVATPEWFDVIEESSGGPVTSFQHLFHKDHINVFSAKKIKELFWRAGLIIEKEDHITYGQTYLLRRGTPEELAAVNPTDFVEGWTEQVEKLEQINKSINFLIEKKPQEAIEAWPKFPEAWIQLIFGVHGKIPEKQLALWNEVSKILPENVRLRLSHGYWLYQQEKFELAHQAFVWLMGVRPNEDVMIHMAWCLAGMGRHKDAIQAFFKASDMNPEKWQECIKAACAQAIQLKTWDERGLEELTGQLLKQSEPKIELDDPAMAPAGE